MILLDTHVWICFLSNPDRIPKKATQEIDEAKKNHSLYVSSISLWVFAILVKKGRLELNMNAGEWLKKSEKHPFLNFLPIDNNLAMESVNLPEPFYDDPADRIIVATSIKMKMPLITIDQRILS